MRLSPARVAITPNRSTMICVLPAGRVTGSMRRLRYAWKITPSLCWIRSTEMWSILLWIVVKRILSVVTVPSAWWWWRLVVCYRMTRSNGSVRWLTRRLPVPALETCVSWSVRWAALKPQCMIYCRTLLRRFWISIVRWPSIFVLISIRPISLVCRWQVVWSPGSMYSWTTARAKRNGKAGSKPTRFSAVAMSSFPSMVYACASVQCVHIHRL